MHDLTLCVHHPAVSQEGFASLTVPTHRASTIVYEDAGSFAQRKQRGPDGYSYGLQGTPTTRTLETQLSALHGGTKTVLTPSGQAAVTLVMLSVLLPGDKVLIPDTVYPPVRDFCTAYLAPRGIGFIVYDPMLGAGIASLIDERTRLVWVESPGSGTMEVQDLPAIARAVKSRGVLLGCDNTWASPLLFKPLSHGADFAVEALTKYVGGHSDLLLGSVTVRDAALQGELKRTLTTLGIGVSPDEVSLALRGIETMGVRLAHSGRVAEEFAHRLQDASSVDSVLHPALPGCPGHDAFQRDFAGSSAVFSVVLKSGLEHKLDAALNAMRLFAIGASWGGTRSLIAPMAITRTAVPWVRRGPVLRLSIGLEDADELWADLETFLRVIEAPAEQVA